MSLLWSKTHVFFLYILLAVSLGLSKNSLCASELQQHPHFFILMQLMVPGNVKRIKKWCTSCCIYKLFSPVQHPDHLHTFQPGPLQSSNLRPLSIESTPSAKENHPAESPSGRNPPAVVTMPCYMAGMNSNTNKIFTSLDCTWLAMGCNEAFDLIKYPFSSVGCRFSSF